MVSKVTLHRDTDDGKETQGDWAAEVADATFSCKTLELPWLDNKNDISCIPKGIYDVKWSFSPHLLKFTYEVLNVPGRSGIRIHAGNFAYKIASHGDILGCIILGSGYLDINYDNEVDLVNSRITVAAFERFMDKQPFTLVIE